MHQLNAPSQEGTTLQSIPKYLEREALDRLIPDYGLAVRSLTSLSPSVLSAFFNADCSSWHSLALTSIQFAGKRRRFSLALKVQLSSHVAQYKFGS